MPPTAPIITAYGADLPGSLGIWGGRPGGGARAGLRRREPRLRGAYPIAGTTM